jgi:hypothetical protein
MRLLAPVLVLFVIGLLGGCVGGDKGTRLEMYHLEEHWVGSKPVSDRDELNAPEGARIIACGPPAACPGAGEASRQTLYYAFTGTPALTAEDLDRDAMAESEVSEETGVVLVFTKTGQSRFHTLTRRIAHAGGRDRRPHHLALVVNDRLVTAAVIDYRLNPDGLTGESVELVGVPRDVANELVEGRRRG